MPNWKNHLGAGIVCTALVIVLLYWLGYSLLIAPNTILILALLIFIGSLFPDLDIRNSKIFGAFLGVAVTIILVSFWRGYTLLGVLTTLALASFSFMQHRGVLHSVSVLGLTCLLVYAITTSLPFVLIWAVCYLSHLILDKEIKLF